MKYLFCLTNQHQVSWISCTLSLPSLLADILSYFCLKIHKENLLNESFSDFNSVSSYAAAVLPVFSFYIYKHTLSLNFS